MPIVVHLADEKSRAAILRSGLRPGRDAPGVFFMPALQSHFVSHQWIRELRRGGARVLIGVYLKLADDHPVRAGRYNREHRAMTLAESIKELRSIDDPRGYELYSQRSIPASSIHRIKVMPATTGWRYMPDAHGRPPCPCPACMRRGDFGRARLLAKERAASIT
ncbi:hypothetical protein BH10PSE17_BH10PSE17_27210 [soil metagenome]